MLIDSKFELLTIINWGLNNFYDMKNMTSEQEQKNIHSDSLNKKEEQIYENLDMENIFSLLHIRNSDCYTILEKVKAIISLILNKRRYEYLKNKCLVNHNGGTKVKVGSTVLENFRVISITTESFRSIRETIMAKNFPGSEYLNYLPGTVLGFSLTRAKHRPVYWENMAEINILGKFGKEYYVKINFFTYN